MVGPEPERLKQLEARERAKRWLGCGAIGLVYAALWLLFAWHASRVGATECTVFRVPHSAYCSVGHVVDGEQHTLPWSDCSEPSWAAPHDPPLAIGAKLNCYYYRSDPSDIFFEPRWHRWFGLGSIAVLLSALASFALGIRYGIVARKLGAVRASATHGYRTAAIVEVEQKPPLSIPLQGRHWSRWLLGAPFLVLGSALVWLSARLGWQTGGELETGTTLLAASSHGTTGVGAFAAFYRSGLVFDPNQGLLRHWWGLGRPFFSSYWPLATLARVRAVTSGEGRRAQHWLTLCFADGTTRRYSRASHAEAEREANRIVAYLGVPDFTSE